MTKKRIIIEVEVGKETRNEMIEHFATKWIKDNFWNPKDSKITVEEIEDERTTE